MAQVYAIVHDGTRCLMFKKNDKSYFHGGNPVNPPSSPHGKNSYCFPGGGLDDEEMPIAGAKREFLEETGVNLTTYHFVGDPRIISTPDYHGVFFQLTVVNFNTVAANCQTHLTAANNMLLTVNQRITNSHIKDNELTAVVYTPPMAPAPAISFFSQNTKDTGWFLDLMAAFHNQ